MWLLWLWEAFWSGLLKVAALWWLIPLFVLIQLLKDSGLLERVSSRLRPALAPFQLPAEAGLPVVAGLLFGLTYGAGVIIQTADEGKLSRTELTVTCVFLGICHALIEETILFFALGVNGLLLAAIRMVAGLLFAFGASRLMRRPASASVR